MLKHSNNITTCRYIQVIKKTETSQKVSSYIQDYLEDNPQQSQKSLTEMSKEPWLYDHNLTHEEAMIYKLKGNCHVCGYDPHYHRDDCPWSANQLMFAELEKVDRSISIVDFAVSKIIEDYNNKK